MIDVSKIFTELDDNRVISSLKGKSIITFGDFKTEVSKYATFFKEFKEQAIILYVEDDLFLFSICFFALLQVKKEVILPQNFQKESFENFENISNVLITNLENLNNKKFTIVKIPIDLPCVAFNFIDMNHEFVSFFTSGSTSTPKKIKKEFKTLSLEIKNICNTQKNLLEKEYAIVGSVAIHHIYGMLWRLLFPLATHKIIDFDLVYSPESLCQKQEDYENLLFVTTPSFLEKILKYKEQYNFKNNILRIYTSGSLLKEDISMGTFDLFKVSPYEIFGSTETGGVASRQQKNGQLFHIFPPVEVLVDNENKIKIISDFAFQKPYQMQDEIVLNNDRTFLLKGRTDRLIKIAEKRVSLPELEKKYESFPLVQKCFCLDIGDKTPVLGALIVLSSEGKTFLKAHSKLELLTTIHEYLLNFFSGGSIPKKTRFAYEIPMNTQGKILVNDIKKIFLNNVAEPIIEDVNFSDDSFLAKLTFIKDSIYFDGHFPSFKILPGVVQVHFVSYFLKKFFRINEIDFDIKKLKFLHIIVPNEEIFIKIIKKSESDFCFEYMKDNKIYSSGIVVIKNKE